MKPTLNSVAKPFLTALLTTFLLQSVHAQSAGYVNLALNRTATASSLESASFPASNAFDGDQATRFSSGNSDNAWITVDLVKASLVKSIVLNWQREYGRDFNILFSTDGSFTDLVSDSIQVRNNVLTSNSVAGTNTITTKSSTVARYVRMQGVHSATGNGYSLFEFQVMGTYAYTNTNFLTASFTGFSLSKLGNSILVGWTMLIETNTSGFSIERSEDAVSFHQVGWVNGQNRGNVATNYSFLDNQPAPGKNYYRIKGLDINGAVAYSGVQLVTNNVSGSIKVYPIPVQDYIAIDYQGAAGEKISVTLSSASGQPVYTDNITIASGLQHIVISRTAAMNAGMYFLSISNSSGKPFMQQLFLQ